MRLSTFVSMLALLAVTAAASAQTQPETTSGVIDFGVRGTTTTGDGARYERYRDLGDGFFVRRLEGNRETNGWLLGFTGDNVGRRDQRLAGDVVRPGKFKGYAMWDQIPMLMSRTTRTLFVEDVESSPNELTIPDAIQAQTQAAPASLLDQFNRFSTEFDTRSRRHSALGGFEYMATRALTIRSQVQFTDRQGTLPYGGSFGHGNFVELPAPINHNLTDVNADAEYSHNALLLRAGYSGSFFTNNATTVTFDNPIRATDILATPSRGRSSLPPSNSFVSVNGTASVRMPHRSRATAYVSVGSLKDAGDPLMPPTINSAITAAPLDRATVEGEARTTSVNLSFVSRPTSYLDFNVRFRSYDYDNRTPVFRMTQRIAYDNTPSALSPAAETEPFGIVRRNFDAEVKLSPVRGSSVGIGYSRNNEDRTHRIFEETAENILRVTFDAMSTGLFSVRTRYEHGQRRSDIVHEDELVAIGEQAGMRHFDIAPRDRDRVTVIGTVSANDRLAVNGSVAVGRDDYRLELPRTNTALESLFGLRDNTHRVYSLGLDGIPNDRVTLGGSYSFERYQALSRSRQATRAPEQFDNPTRNWSAEGTDTVHSIIASAGITQIAEKVDLQFSYDYNRARAVYEYFTGAVPNRTLPEEVTVPGTLPTPTGLPTVKSDTGRANLDLTYAWTRRVGIGFSYWFEQYKVSDFTLDEDANPALARSNVLLLGYLYRPYTANTFWGRLIIRW